MIAGTGTYSTAHSVHLTALAHELGVHGFLVVTPYYNKPPQRGIVDTSGRSRRRPTSRSSPTTSRAASIVNIEPETMAELAEIPNVRAVKQANDDLDQARRIVELGLDLYAGDDKLIFPFLGLGGVGGVCVHTHVAGPQMKEMVAPSGTRATPKARAASIDEMRPALDLLKIAPNPIPIKAALNLLGHEVGGFRLPMVPADRGRARAVRDCLERAGLSLPPRRHRPSSRHGATTLRVQSVCA